MKLFKLICVAFLAFSLSAQAVDLDKDNRDPKYVEAIVARSQKIVDKLDLKSKSDAKAVRNIIANRYFELNDIYDVRDAKKKQAKESLQGDAKNKAIKAAENEKDAALYKTHFAYSVDLSIYLTPKQIEAVKDGMTYNTLEVTYGAYQAMIPTLKDGEKKQIYAWLVEAREHAIDAESANKKHEAFGKYKGRINNYLSKQGYDLEKERNAWYQRIEAAKNKKK